MPKVQNRYSVILERVFRNHFKAGLTEFEFLREEFEQIANELKIVLPKNLGDVIYSVRFRSELPDYIISKAPKGKFWIIELAGRGKYKFCLTSNARIEPRENLLAIEIPNATPEIIAKYALNDEQALLALVRYNRLVDIFLGITTYSLQSHMRTTVKGIGQVEIDEIYVGINKTGEQFIIPVQAKGGTDKLGPMQSKQDILCCREKFPKLTCRAISAQFMGSSDNRVVALFELVEFEGEIKVSEEKHYKLVKNFDSNK